jgi:hypothetical protein
VLSNSGDPQIQDLDSARRWTFPATTSLPTYNSVINAGPYYEIRRSGAGHDLGLCPGREALLPNTVSLGCVDSHRLLNVHKTHRARLPRALTELSTDYP